MQTMRLIRYAYAPFGTYGVLYVGNQKFYTVEQPWRLNQKMKSCIPEGTYELVPHHSKKYPNSIALVNHAIGVYHQPTPQAPPNARIAILIHTGNTPADVSGCIAPGMGLGMTNNMWSVVNSRVALDRIQELIKTLSIGTITITSVNKARSVDDMPYLDTND